MDFITNFPLFTIVLSLFSGVLMLMLKGKAARNYTIVYESVLIVLVSCVLWYTLETGTAFTYVMGEFPAPWGNEIRAGVLEAVLALAFLVIMLCSVFAGYRFVDTDIDESKVNLYYSLLNLLTAALMALVWTNDIFTGYVFLEILTLTSCGILIVRELGRTTLAAVRYMIMNLLGSGLFLLGLSILYTLTGHLLFPQLGETVRGLTAQDRYSVPLYLSFLLMTMGLCIKSALYPFHTWLPDAYSNATAVSGALLSSLVSKLYIFLLIKVNLRAAGEEVFIQRIRDVLFLYAAAGTVLGSVHALRQRKLSRVIAYSSVAQIACLYLGIALGSREGIAATLFYILAHSAAKSMLFLTAHKLRMASGGADGLEPLRGAANLSPLAGLAFLLGACSLVGIPGLGGFAAKLYLAQAAVSAGGWKMPVLLGLLALSTALNVVYMLRTALILYSREKPHGEAGQPKTRDSLFAAAMVVMIGLNIFLGVCGQSVLELIYCGMALFS